VFIIVDDGGRVNEWTGFCGCDEQADESRAEKLEPEKTK
jgi:hypothetical protein